VRERSHHGLLVAEEAITDLRIDASFRLRVVDGLLTGMHEPDTSHFDLMHAFATPSLLRRAHAHAAELGYLGHELGDVALILAA
jgi:S-adenosylmethionine:tRNA ribosyltransferase-isomerase